jgi:arylsulfatase
LVHVSAYNMGIMGYRTPNIDRIGREGAIFTDWYGRCACKQHNNSIALLNRV